MTDYWKFICTVADGTDSSATNTLDAIICFILVYYWILKLF
jgi:hypothetical protein